MKILFLIFSLAFLNQSAGAQKSYIKNISAYLQAYVDSHEVVKGKDKMYFRFFPANKKYRVTAGFSKIFDTTGFIMKTSGTVDKKFFRYGLLTFMLHNKVLHLTVYQNSSLLSNEEYKNYLFIPFTDHTSGEESYGGGKYLDITIDEIKNNRLILDFNKAYNPYCVYAKGYNCPIPPRENDLQVTIKAGEKNFLKD